MARFYELPALNAGGFSKIRPIATHNRGITDYCSWRGLLVMSGTNRDGCDNRHIIRSEDGQCALWVGSVDDLWKLGKPRGRGGPWKNHRVRADQPSEPYLMTGFDRKTLYLSHEADRPVDFRVEVDISGDGDWCLYETIGVPAGQRVRHRFPEGFQAYWIRFAADQDVEATAQLEYL